HQWVHRSCWGARAALVTQLVGLVFAPVAVLAGSAVLIDLTPAGTLDVWSQLRVIPPDAARGGRSRLQAQSPTDEGDHTVPIATEARAVPDHVDLAPRQRQMSASIGPGRALPESELTFTKGYPQRRAAQLAAGIISQPPTPQITTAVAIV